MFSYNLEHLRAFYFTAKLKSFSKASEALFISQPAISSSIAKLEKHFGCRLFDRSAKIIELTEEGNAFFGYVAPALERLMLGERELELAKKSKAGTVRIAATETPLYRFILPKLRAFNEGHPDIFISISGGGSVSEAFALVLANEADIAFGVTPLAETNGLEVFPKDSFCDAAAASSAFSELSGRKIPLQELCKYPLVSARRGTNARASLDLWFAEQGMIFAPTYSVHTSSAVLAFALNSVGVGILPSLLAEGHIGENGLFIIETDRPLPHREIVMAHKRNAPLQGAARTFVEFLDSY